MLSQISFEMSLRRFLTVYIGFTALVLFFLYLAFLILKRRRTHLSKIFSCFYFISAIGLIINLIYVPIKNESIVFFLNFLTNFSIAFSAIFLLIFNLILLKSQKIITRKREAIIIVVYGGALFLMVFIPDGITINESTNWNPVFSLSFYLYLMVIITIGDIIPTLFFGYQIYGRFEDEDLKSKWKFFMLGFILLSIMTIGTFSSNYINTELFDTIWLIPTMILPFLAPYLIYKGVGKQLEDE